MAQDNNDLQRKIHILMNVCEAVKLHEMKSKQIMSFMEKQLTKGQTLLKELQDQCLSNKDQNLYEEGVKFGEKLLNFEWKCIEASLNAMFNPNSVIKGFEVDGQHFFGFGLLTEESVKKNKQNLMLALTKERKLWDEKRNVLQKRQKQFRKHIFEKQ